MIGPGVAGGEKRVVGTGSKTGFLGLPFCSLHAGEAREYGGLQGSYRLVIRMAAVHGSLFPYPRSPSSRLLFDMVCEAKAKAWTPIMTSDRDMNVPIARGSNVMTLLLTVFILILPRSSVRLELSQRTIVKYFVWRVVGSCL